MEKASKTEMSDIASTTFSSVVKRYEILGPSTKQEIQKNTPSVNEVLRMTLTANFAAFAFPRPNSFDTRTLTK